MPDSCDVVVVGAGFAGITAARDLAQAGHSVIVVEGRDRIGGRTYTDDAIGRPVELGGAYVHWTQANLFRELQRHGFQLTTPLPVERVHWLAEGTLHSGTEAEFDAVASPGMNQFVADARECVPYPFDLTVADLSAAEKESFGDRMARLDLTPEERDVLDGVLSYTMADPDGQGVAQILLWTAIYFGDWHALWESGAYWRIDGGTKGLIDAMAAESGAEIRLSTPVSSVDDRGDEVVVTTRAGETITARSVVIAVPVNALSDIAITPPVSAPVQEFVDNKHPMLNRKLWVRVKGEIEAFNAYAPLGQNPITIAMAEYRHEGDTLVVCFCPDATALDPDDLDAVQEALRVFVPDIEVVATSGHDWADDEFSQGTWMMTRPGQLTHNAPEMRKPHGRLHFAGSDIAPIFLGWIEGAIESGALAARAVTTTLTGRA